MKIVDTGDGRIRMLCGLDPGRWCCAVGQRAAHQVSYHVEMVGETAVTRGVRAM